MFASVSSLCCHFSLPGSSLLSRLPAVLSATCPHPLLSRPPGIPSGDWGWNSLLGVSSRLISSWSFPQQTMRQWPAGGGLRKTAARGSCNLCVKPAGRQRGEKSSPGQTGPSTQPAPGTTGGPNLKVTWVALKENSHKPPSVWRKHGWVGLALAHPPWPDGLSSSLHNPICPPLSPAGRETSPDRHHLILAMWPWLGWVT